MSILGLSRLKKAMCGYCFKPQMAIDSKAMDTSTTIYEFVMTHLRAKAIPQKQIARDSGVPFSTLSKIAQGAVKDPGVHTVQRLADYFANQSQAKASAPYPVAVADPAQQSAA
jgi:predicted transcriptional regulator